LTIINFCIKDSIKFNKIKQGIRMAILQYSVTRKNNISTITIGGSLDAKTAPGFNTKLHDEIKKGSTVLIIDMEKLDYIASAGLGVLINCNEEVNKIKGSLRLCKINEKVKKIFKLLGFLSLFKIYATADEAAKA
jgi:anti-anti-sigma factor